MTVSVISQVFQIFDKYFDNVPKTSSSLEILAKSSREPKTEINKKANGGRRMKCGELPRGESLRIHGRVAGSWSL